MFNKRFKFYLLFCCNFFQLLYPADRYLIYFYHFICRISYSDFVKTFTHLEAVHLDSDTSRDEPSLHHKQTWQMRLYQGSWQKGVSAGGCRNNPGAGLVLLCYHIFTILCITMAIHYIHLWYSVDITDAIMIIRVNCTSGYLAVPAERY